MPRECGHPPHALRDGKQSTPGCPGHCPGQSRTGDAGDAPLAQTVTSLGSGEPGTVPEDQDGSY